ncbi:MAG: sulfatase-like hydrolase/transferase [Bacteroidota bacterium]
MCNRIPYLFLTWVILLFLTGCQSSNETNRKRKPNLVFILTDEQRYDTSAPYGNMQIKTPNLNRLGEGGVVFERAYVASPVCSPARSTILTGLYPHTNGVTSNSIPLSDTVKTFPELINDPEYNSAYIGKWHLGRENDAWHGFDYRFSTEGWYTDDDTTNQTDYNKWLVAKGYQPDLTDSKTFSRSFVSTLPYEDSKSKFIELKGLEFIEANKEQPFILYLSFLEPHFPHNGPFNHIHDTSTMVLDSSYYRFDRPAQGPLNDHMLTGYPSRELPIKELVARYWGLVHQVDLTIGKVLDKLRDADLEENTIVVFTSEHGIMLKKFGQNGKSVMYDQSSRVPFIIKAPGVNPISVAQPVSHIDLVPTLLDLFHVPIPGQLQGQSLLPIMHGRKTPESTVFMEWIPKGYSALDIKFCPEWASLRDCVAAKNAQVRTAVTSDGWKLIWNNTHQSQLFNLNKDREELTNLYQDPAYTKQIEVLEDQILTWQNETNDKYKFSK